MNPYWTYFCYCIFFPPIFSFLFVLGIIKGAIFSPFVFLVIAFGDAGVVIGLWPLHLFWSIYCLIRTNKFGVYMKLLLICTVPIPIAIWTIVGVVGSAIMGIGYGFVWPVMETFRAISKKDMPLNMRLIKCFTDGTWTQVQGACTIVRDFADFSFHTYFSFMDDLLDSKGENPIELKVLQLPGCLLVAILGIVVNIPLISLISLYKGPILLFKGWQQLIRDLIGREGPFLETVCVPFAGFWILLWPLVVLFAIIAGILSSFPIGLYSAVVAYQESSTKRGFNFVVAAASVYDEYTNDLLYLREGSCFPRPQYRERADSTASLLPVLRLRQQMEFFYADEPLVNSSANVQKLTAAVIWDEIFRACESIGKELLNIGAIHSNDIDGWKKSKNKIVNIGIPAYAFLDCFLRSIKEESVGFLLRNNIEITSVNRPEGRILDWLYEPMSVMKKQIKNLNLQESEELYFYKLCLYGGDTARVEYWQNGGIAPQDEIRRAQLEGLSRRLRGFCLTISRLPTSYRKFDEVVKAIEQSKQTEGYGVEDNDIEANR
ncbi:putative membrane protein At3g27390 isoform X1 [Apium graveolens]|uniref:putative membrane protein At3g27390 isoform X1 n=2 Tax=Apium graveolens TaxID=4045 RepID=UPI003D7A8D96